MITLDSNRVWKVKTSISDKERPLFFPHCMNNNSLQGQIWCKDSIYSIHDQCKLITITAMKFIFTTLLQIPLKYTNCFENFIQKGKNAQRLRLGRILKINSVQVSNRQCPSFDFQPIWVYKTFLVVTVRAHSWHLRCSLLRVCRVNIIQ